MPKVKVIKKGKVKAAPPTAGAASIVKESGCPRNGFDRSKLGLRFSAAKKDQTPSDT